MKPKAYIETSIISYLTAKPSKDVRVAANRNITLEWWETRRFDFDLFISEFVVTEAALGDAESASRRQKAIEGIAELEATEGVRELGKALISEGPIPPQAEVDAYHIVIAAVNGMDYLLTWTVRTLPMRQCARRLRRYAGNTGTNHRSYAPLKN